MYKLFASTNPHTNNALYKVKKSLNTDFKLTNNFKLTT